MQTHTKLGTIYKPALKNSFADVGQLLGSRLYIVPTTFGMPIVDSQQAFWKVYFKINDEGSIS